MGHEEEVNPNDADRFSFSALLRQLDTAHNSEITRLRAEIIRLKAQVDGKGSISSCGRSEDMSVQTTTAVASDDRSGPRAPQPVPKEASDPSEDQLQNQNSSRSQDQLENQNSSRSQLKGSKTLDNLTPTTSSSSLNKKKNAKNLVTEMNKAEETTDQGFLLGIVKDTRFDLFFACLILLNTLLMAAETEYDGYMIGATDGLTPGGASEDPNWPGALLAFKVARWALGIFFTIELLMKLGAYRHRIVLDVMNWLDMLVVSLWIASVWGVALGSNASFVRLVRLVRLLRLLKVLRAFESLDALFLMTTALRGSLTTLSWALVIFLGALSFFALIMSQVLAAVYFEDTSQPLEKRRQVFIYFGTFSRSLFTMFELTFANWPPVARMLYEDVSGIFMVLSVLYKLSMGFAVVGVINGVFMQETFKVAGMDDTIMLRQRERTTKNHAHKMERLFQACDTSHDGKIRREELCEVLQDDSVRHWLAAMEFPVFTNSTDIDRLFDTIDSDGSGEITVAELIAGVNYLKGSARSFELILIMRDVSQIHDDLEDLRRVMAKLSPPPPQLPPHTTLRV